MLDTDNPIVHQVGDVCSGLVLWVRHQQHPANVRVPETPSGVVRVSMRVRVPVVDSVRVAPPLDGALDGGGAKERKEDLQRISGLVCSVGPQPVVPSRDGKTRQTEQGEGKRHRLHGRLHPVGAAHGDEGEQQDKQEVQPVHVLVPVLPGPWLLRDVLLPFVLETQLLVPLQHLGDTVLGQLLRGHSCHRLGAHQTPANARGDDSLLLLVRAGSNSVSLCDVNGFHGLCDTRNVYLDAAKKQSFDTMASTVPSWAHLWPVVAGGQ